MRLSSAADGPASEVEWLRGMRVAVQIDVGRLGRQDTTRSALSILEFAPNALREVDELGRIRNDLVAIGNVAVGEDFADLEHGAVSRDGGSALATRQVVHEGEGGVAGRSNVEGVDLPSLQARRGSGGGGSQEGDGGSDDGLHFGWRVDVVFRRICWFST